MDLGNPRGRFQLGAGPERQLWGGGVLGDPAGEVFTSHLVAEVWQDGFVCLAMSGSETPSAFSALLASRNDFPTRPLVPADSVMMGGRTEVPFLGRLVLELYSGGSTAAVIEGADTGAIYSATISRVRQVAAG